MNMWSYYSTCIQNPSAINPHYQIGKFPCKSKSGSMLPSRSEAFMMAKVNTRKTFYGYQSSQLAKNYQHFRNHLCPQHQGLIWHKIQTVPSTSHGPWSELTVSQWSVGPGHTNLWLHPLALYWLAPSSDYKPPVGTWDNLNPMSHQTLTMGAEMIHEMIIFNQMTWLIVQEDFIMLLLFCIRFLYAFLKQLAYPIPIHARNGGFNVLLTTFIPITDDFFALSIITLRFHKVGYICPWGYF
jgi:hypothetical protein